VPDPVYPFLGVHLTLSIHGGLQAGPNAVLALARAGYSWQRVSARDIAELMTFPGMWRLARLHCAQGARELQRSLSRHAFGNALRRMVPATEDEDLVQGRGRDQRPISGGHGFP
jgi:L-2-hydroxyglutarate oxidase